MFIEITIYEERITPSKLSVWFVIVQSLFFVWFKILFYIQLMLAYIYKNMAIILLTH